MLYSNTKNLKERIIRILAEHAALNANELRALLLRQQFAVTVQGVYKELRNLGRDAVITKIGKYYSLSLTWILNISALTDKMFDSHLETLPEATVSLATKSKKTWKFSNIQKLNDYWTQLMFLLLQRSQSKVFYQWIPWVWFELLGVGRSITFQEAVKIGGYKIRTILRDHSYIESRFSEHIKISGGSYSVTSSLSPFHNLLTTFYSLLDEYLITVQIDNTLMLALKDLFETTTNASELSSGKVQQVLSLKGQYTISLEHGTKKAKQVRKAMVEYFD